LENKDGIVYLENGNLTIINPEGLGRYPRITAGKNVEIYINGEKENKEVVVSQDIEELIELKIKQTNKSKELNIKVSRNKLKAYLLIVLIPEQKLEIKDKEPANHIKIETKSQKKVYPKISKTEILELLDYYNISYGINHDQISKIMTQKGNLNGEYLIAEGKKAKKGENAQVIQSEKYKQRDENLFNVIDSIEKGETML